MAQWIRHLTTNQGIPGSSPGKVEIFFGDKNNGTSVSGLVAVCYLWKEFIHLEGLAVFATYLKK